jgi:hypothetical protein
MAAVFAKGGFSKSRQLPVLIALVRAEHGRAARWLTLGSLVGLVLGGLFLFAGISADDLAREKRCQRRCVEEGHPRGVIGPSSQQSMTRRNSAAFVACLCSGGPGRPIELRADSL